MFRNSETNDSRYEIIAIEQEKIYSLTVLNIITDQKNVIPFFINEYSTAVYSVPKLCHQTCFQVIPEFQSMRNFFIFCFVSIEVLSSLF